MKNKLQQGISILYDIELNNFLMSSALKKLANEINNLALPKKINRPYQKSEPYDIWWSFICFGAIGCLILAVIGAIYAFMVFCDFDWDSLLIAILSGLGRIILFGAIGAIIGGIVGIITNIIQTNIINKRHFKTYIHEMENYENVLIKENYRLKTEKEQKRILTDQYYVLKNKRNESIEKLHDYYNIIGIDQKFQNIICMGYINEYFRLEITNKLGGVDGAYNLLLKDLRFDQLNYMLEKISYQLEQVIDSQRSLYDELRSINYRCNEIVTQTVRSIKENQKDLERIAQNTNLIAYNEERIQTELAFQNFMLSYH